MATPILIVLSNPVSASLDDAFNEWYSRVHGREVTELAGIRNITRYRAKAQLMPGGGVTYRYLALYELDDADTALASLAAAARKFTQSDAADFAGANGIVFEQIFTSKP